MTFREKLRRVAYSIPFVLLGLWAILRLLFGGGDDYEFVIPPKVEGNFALERWISYDEPFGNVAISKDGRIFFSVHPESGSTDRKLMEWKNDVATAYPSLKNQTDSFKTVLGIYVDKLDRLWVLDNGNHGLEKATVRAYSMENDSLLYFHEFPKAMAPTGSMLNDIRVSNDGRFLFISDASIIAGNPAILVHDTHEKQSRRRLEDHESVEAQDWRINTAHGDLSYFGSTLTIQPGVDGIAIDDNGEYLYYASMCHDELFRVPVKSLSNLYITERQLEESIEALGKKPLSDGMCMDSKGNLFITDVEHGAVMLWNEADGMQTLVEDSEKIRWADGVCVWNDHLYLTDSALPKLILTGRSAVKEHAPYYLYRIKLKQE